jgi:hypothetical protein
MHEILKTSDDHGGFDSGTEGTVFAGRYPDLTQRESLAAQTLGALNMRRRANTIFFEQNDIHTWL